MEEDVALEQILEKRVLPSRCTPSPLKAKLVLHLSTRPRTGRALLIHEIARVHLTSRPMPLIPMSPAVKYYFCHNNKPKPGTSIDVPTKSNRFRRPASGDRNDHAHRYTSVTCYMSIHVIFLLLKHPKKPEEIAWRLGKNDLLR